MYFYSNQQNHRCSGAKETFSRWGFKMEKDLCTLKARVVDPNYIVFGGGSNEKFPQVCCLLVKSIIIYFTK